MRRDIKTNLREFFFFLAFNFIPVLHLGHFLTGSRWLFILESICFTGTPDKITELMKHNICHFKISKSAVWTH